MSAAKTASVQSLMTKAQQALTRNHWFEAERLCAKALDMARAAGDFNLMARICLPLQEARRQRREIAFDSRRLVIVQDAIPEERAIEPVCYLVQPPLVGADARRLRLIALEREIPAIVLCREPRTQLGLCPVVAIGQVTIRTRIDPPKKWDKPTLEWYAEALEQLGDAAIETLDAGAEPSKQVDALLERLDAMPDHENLHQALAETCRLAGRHYVEGVVAPPRAAVRLRTGEEQFGVAHSAELERDEGDEDGVDAVDAIEPAPPAAPSRPRLPERPASKGPRRSER
ncbi:MAG: hypothetical protein ACKO0W_02070 [Planctomycetota bacterium]